MVILSTLESLPTHIITPPLTSLCLFCNSHFELLLLAIELSIQPHLDNLVSAAKYLVAKQYGSNGNGSKSNSSSFIVIVIAATVK